MAIRRICVWSGPRNISTALMYSFAQRSDTRVVDEPLYGHYLRVSGVDHPGRDDVLAAMETDGARVVQRVILGPCERPVLFMKQMAHHLVELDRSFLSRTENVILIRHPREVLMSLVHQIPEPRVEDTGIAVQAELFDQLEELGQEPPVIDSRELLLAPREVLTDLLGRLGLQFEEPMLGWTAGARPEDGVWANHWYRNVHQSTGFAPYRPKRERFPDRLKPVLEQCKPHYERLAATSLRAPRERREG